MPEHRRDRIEPLTIVIGETKAVKIIVGGEHLARPADLELQIAEAVERVRAAAGGDATAVLAPPGRVLDIPELAVG